VATTRRGEQERLRRLLFRPWGSLTEAEKGEAVVEARRRGRRAARAEFWGWRNDCGEPPEPARPAAYLALTAGCCPEEARAWCRAGAAQLAADARVCAFGRGWEMTRRFLLGYPPVPVEGSRLRHDLVEAYRGLQRAHREYERARAGCWAGGLLPVFHPQRLALGLAHVRLWHARDAYWLAVMLARDAGALAGECSWTREDDPVTRPPIR
jgi:hypothetical protein